MDSSVSQPPVKLSPETQAFVEEFCPPNLSDADLLEIKESLFHLGNAIYLYHLQKTGVKNA